MWLCDVGTGNNQSAGRHLCSQQQADTSTVTLVDRLDVDYSAELNVRGLKSRRLIVEVARLRFPDLSIRFVR
jgi:hypothetical protein